MKPQTKEEGDLEALWSWMEVGGLPARPEEEVRGLLLEVIFFLWVSMWLSITFYISTPALFNLLGVGFVEEGEHSTRRGPEVRD